MGRPAFLVEPLESRALLANVPAGFVDANVVTGLTSPTSMAIAPDGRIFVTQQAGAIRVIKNGSLLATPFATLTVSSINERGLGGLVFDPNFASNNFLYVYYTATTPFIHNRISRLTASGDVIAAGSELPIFDLPDLQGSISHMGGALHFGADGKLYVATGNHDQLEVDPQQSLVNLFGKMLRINPDGSIPADNPFYSVATGQNRAIWAYGLRNPFTFAIQPGTGRMLINDVGQDTWEEINEGLPGSNYGWPLSEGQTSDPRFVSPVHTYDHSQGCAITGGDFYNPAAAQFPSSYVGDYFFSDLCGGFIRSLDPATGVVTPFATSLAAPVDVDVAPDGSIYYLERNNGGRVRRITYAPVGAPTITQQPAGQTVNVGEPATFTVAAAGTGSITYKWQRRNAGAGSFLDIPGETALTYTLNSPTLADSDAQFRAVATNSSGSTNSSAAVLTVTTNVAPTAQIITPLLGTTFFHGQTINYSGGGTDPEDGVLPAAALTWQVDYYTNNVQRPFVPPTSGQAGGSFVIPTSSPYTGTDVFYRIRLTVTDSAGRMHTTTRDLVPQVSTVTLTASAPGLQIRLDGQPHDTPYTFQGVAGLTRSLQATTAQIVGGVSYDFATWSDGGAAAHNISMPASDTTYAATFLPQQITWLSNLNPTFAQNGSGPFERDQSNGSNGANDGDPIALNFQVYTKGLGVHAYSELRYNLAGGGFTRFLADVGVDDEVMDEGSVVFQVWTDGVKIYDSGTMNGQTFTKHIDVSVAGKNEIRLIVTDSGNGNTFDHADWAAARLVRPMPSVISSNFLFATSPHRLQFRFDANVSASLSAADLLLENLTTGQTVPAAFINPPAYDGATNTATFTFSYPNNVLPDGDYRATLLAAGITTAGGIPLPFDHQYEFFHLTGDANRDRRVDSDDFNILASNFGLPVSSFSLGDFNYDGIVSSDDFNLLASRFGVALGALGSV